MFETRARPVLEGQLGLRIKARVLNIHTLGHGESDLNERLRDLFGADPRINFALLSEPGQVDVRLTAVADAPPEPSRMDSRDRFRATQRALDLRVRQARQ